MDRPNKKPIEDVLQYLGGQGLTPVNRLDDIKESVGLVEVIGDGNQYCDFYVAIARRYEPEGNQGKPQWDLTGAYAWAWVPDKPEAIPPHEFNRSRRHEVTEENIAQKAYYIITKGESPLGRIVAKLREQ